MFRIVMALNAFLGTIFAACAAYYTAAPYYGWKPTSEGPMGTLANAVNHWQVAFLAVGIVLIVLSCLQAFGVIGGAGRFWNSTAPAMRNCHHLVDIGQSSLF
jgi:hypothetical protein